MRIVQLIMSRQFRGAEVFAAQLSGELVKLGHVVRYVSLYTIDAKEFIPVGISYHDLLVKKSGALNFELIWRLRKYLNEFKPDVVQANAGDTLKYAVLVKWMFGVSYKIVFRNASMVSQYIMGTLRQAQGTFVEPVETNVSEANNSCTLSLSKRAKVFKGSFKSFPQKVVTSFLLKKTDFIVSVSDQTKADLLALYPFCKSKIETIPIGVTPKPFNKLPSFNNRCINLVHVGGFTFEKNHEGLLRIMVELRKNMPTALLWLVGDGPLKVKIEGRVEKLGLSDCVNFVGAVTNSMDYIHSADVLLLPSHIEGLPGVILEAFLCKTPVVAYAVGGIGDIVENGETGWTVPKDEEQQFVSKVLEVLSSKDQVQQVVGRAHGLVIHQFDNTVIAKRFLNVYERLIR